MEAVVFFLFFGLYILIRVLLGGGESDWDRQEKRHQTGVQAFRNREYVVSAQIFRKRQKSFPYDVLPLVYLGELALLEDEAERALAFGQKALRLDNTVWQPHFLMARALDRAGQSQEALKRARNAAWIGRDVAKTQYLLGKLLLADGQTEAGLSFMEKAYNLGEEDAILFLRRSPLSPTL